MNRTLTILLSAYWTASFAFAAWAAAEADGRLAAGFGAAPQPAWQAWSLAEPLFFVLASALVSVLFLWTLLVAVLERGGEETDEVARLACSAALTLFLATTLRDALAGAGTAPPAATLPLLALLASYLVMRREGGEALPAAAGAAGRHTQVARLSALDAAHGTLLERLATPRDFARMPPANDDRIR